jgi:precorrin-8X/cobalt-precorrin-8 methylmutase
MNCSLCKYRVQIVGFEEQVGAPQQPHHMQVRGAAPASIAGASGAAREAGGLDVPRGSVPMEWRRYEPHPIEAESFRIIEAGRDWSGMPEGQRRVAQRLVHTSGDFNIVD